MAGIVENMDPVVLNIDLVPGYFPDLTFFGRLAGAERCNLALAAPYVRQSYHNRTRIRRPQGWMWLSVPVKKCERGTPLLEIPIDYSTPWVQDHLKGLRYNYSTSPYYEHYEPAIRRLLLSNPVMLHELTAQSVIWSANALHLETLVTPNMEAAPSSEMEEVDPEHTPDAKGATSGLQEYRQNFPGFEPGMSVLDLLFNHGPASRLFLDSVEI
jgi:hypothetical protein